MVKNVNLSVSLRPQVARKKLTPPIKYHGGKQRLAKWIVSKMPPHVHYVEPYFGGGGVLFALNPQDRSEVVGDINGELVNFFDVIASQELFPEFARQCNLMPFAEEIFKRSLKSTATSQVDCAVAYFTRLRMSRQGLGKCFATLSRNRLRSGMNEQVSGFQSAVAGLPEIHARLRRVVIRNCDALTLINAEDGPNTLFYLDPPYVHATRVAKKAYDFEMTDEQHAALLERLPSVKGKFLLSGYPNALYDTWATRNGICHCDTLVDFMSSSAKTKKKKVERLWANFDIADLPRN